MALNWKSAQKNEKKFLGSRNFVFFLDIMKKIVSICRLKYRKLLKKHFFYHFSPPYLNFQDTWDQMVLSVPIFSINILKKKFLIKTV